MAEVWHELEIDDEWISIEHAHYENPDECDLALFLAAAGKETWDYLFAHGTGNYHVRMWAGELAIRPATTVKVLDLDEAS